MNVLELHNEFLILSMFYFMFIYSDGLLMMKHPDPEYDEQISDIERKQKAAWGNIALIAIMFFDNLVIILFVQCKLVYTKIRLVYRKRKHK